MFISNTNYESCFIEIENENKRNIIVGVIYRAHTPINGFITDINPVLQKINEEKKLSYIMGDYNIDLLKVECDRRIHDYLDLIYSYSLIPTIYKPTRITESSATCIDNILTNDNGNINQSLILVSDLSDHLPIVLSSKYGLTNKPAKVKSNMYRRVHSDDNISKLKKKLSDVKWQEILDNTNVDSDYDKFLETFNQ